MYLDKEMYDLEERVLVIKDMLLEEGAPELHGAILKSKLRQLSHARDRMRAATDETFRAALDLGLVIRTFRRDPGDHPRLSRDARDGFEYFLHRACVVGPRYRSAADVLFNSYAARTQRAGWAELDREAFDAQMEDYGFVPCTAEGKDYWAGLRPTDWREWMKQGVTEGQ